MGMWLLSSIALAAPGPDVLAAAWSHTGEAPLTAADLATLATGEPVAHRVDAESQAAATAWIWVDAPVAETWVAIQDAAHRPLGRADTQFLPGDTPGRRKVYVRLDLPWPVADRQWLAEYVSDAEAWAGTGGKVWRRTWSLVDPVEAPDPDPSAVWVTENRGRWTLVAAGEGTLACVSVHTAFGGAVPREISQTWATGSLKRMLRTLAAIAPEMATHYDAGHAVVYAPDGTPIAPFGL